MEPNDLLAGRKPREHLSRVPLHGACRIGFETTALDREVHDLAERFERVIGVAGGGSAEPAAPFSDLRGGYAVEQGLKTVPRRAV